MQGILKAGAKVYGTVDVKTNLIDLARLANLKFVEEMITERLSAQVESLRVRGMFATLNENWGTMLRAESENPELMKRFGAKAMTRNQLGRPSPRQSSSSQENS